ncbi:DNA-3-methyladenine glycosylase II [Cryptococcus neoformans]|nr:DNA-3-methyladenine glycosylase II [Cryptococcus neoformans var. grubii]
MPSTRSKTAKSAPDMPSVTRAARTIRASTATSKRVKPDSGALSPSAGKDHLKPSKKKQKVEPCNIDAQPPSTALELPTVPQPALLSPTLNFNLPSAISHLSALDPRFSLFFEHLPCRPFVNLEAIDPFRTLVTSIIGQQVSWMAAKAINTRFRALFGFTHEKEGFPSPQMVLMQDVASLRGAGLSGRKAEYVLSLADHFASGQLSTQLLQSGTDEEISEALIAVRGIGQWTIDMFMIFSLRRPDILAVGDLGVQKGLLKWALAAHGALEMKSSGTNTPKKTKGNANKGEQKVIKEEVDDKGEGKLDTNIKESIPVRHVPLSSVPPMPLRPNDKPEKLVPKMGALHTPVAPSGAGVAQVPPTPSTPSAVPCETVEVPPKTLPGPTPEVMLTAPLEHPDWDPHRAAPLIEGLSVEILKSRLNGKKVKGGAYLTPKEMETLTEGWRPYRSLAVFYMWPVSGE